MTLPFPIWLLPAERHDIAQAQFWAVERILRGAHTEDESLGEALVMAGWWTQYLLKLARLATGQADVGST